MKNNKYIPDQAFLYFPLETDPDFKSGQGKAIKRNIYNGCIKYTSYQIDQMNNLESALRKSGIQMPQSWSFGQKLRFLSANQFNIKKTLKQVLEHNSFLKNRPKNLFTDSVAKYISQGIFYMCGRDYKFRPIIVTDAKRIVESKITSEQFKELCIFYTEYLLQNFMIQGQVQNFIQLFNVQNQNLFSMITVIRDGVIYLSQHYKARTFKAYVVNVPSTFSLFWQIAKKFVNEDQKKKIVFDDGKQIAKILKIANPYQIQQKFGGKRNNITQFWPIPDFHQDYKVQGMNINLIDKQQYRSKFQNGELQERKVNNKFLQPKITKLNLTNLFNDQDQKATIETNSITSQTICNKQKQKNLLNKSYFQERIQRLSLIFDAPLCNYF